MHRGSHPEVVARLRRSYAGILLADETAASCRFVIDPVCGSLVFPAQPLVLDAEHPVLLVPDEAPDATHLLLTVRGADADTDPACDRWRIYHGRPEGTVFVRARVASAKVARDVWGAEEIPLTNPLHADEPALCKSFNADPDALRRLCERLSGRPAEHALLVGVDPCGIDIRRRFGVLRVEFPDPLPWSSIAPDTPAAASAAIAAECLIRSLLREKPTP